MSEIHEFVSVDCPFDRLPRAVEALLRTYPSKGAHEYVVPLTAKVGDLVAERDAVITLTQTREYPGYKIMEIAWHAAGGGLYPVFQGTLSAGEEGVQYCRLDLDGAYDPPLGLAGAAFDAVLGHRIAEATARQLLALLKTGCERAYAQGSTA